MASEFKASGFFADFAKPPDNLPLARGLMKKKSDRIVLSKDAADLVYFATEHVSTTRDRANACFQNLVEVMTNTHNHAGDRPAGHYRARQHERWFASVYCREKTAYFSFVDLGVGVLRSAPVRSLLRKAGISISVYGRIRLLKDVFDGRVGSATGKPGRGLGLPRMKSDADSGRLLDLQVLTSDVVGPVAGLDFKSVEQSFRGTAFRWRIGQEGGGQ